MLASLSLHAQQKQGLYKGSCIVILFHSESSSLLFILFIYLFKLILLSYFLSIYLIHSFVYLTPIILLIK